VSLVLDTSVALAWVYIQERSAAIAAVFDQITEAGAWVPSLWRLEVANVLEMGVRRGRNDATFRDATLADFELLPIQSDSETVEHAWQSTLRLAERHRLTVYDAAYLELAMRRGLPLATLDRDLRTAAAVVNVTLLGESKYG
jgi:predicted nucleic acid-binding protein